MAAFTTVVEAIQQKAELLGHKPAFIFRDKYDGRRVLSFQQLYDLGGRWAAVLRSRLLGQGDLVVNTLPNSPERVIIELGIVLSGAASVNGQCQLADGSDLLHVLSKSRAHAIVLDPDVTNSPWNVLKCHVTLGENGDVTSDELPSLRHVYMVRRTDECGDGDFMSYLETLTDRYQAEVKPDDAITVYTTSGSTGFSKLVVITHAYLISVLHDVIQDPKQHVGFSIAPLGWVGGYACCYFLNGFTRVLCDARSGSPDDMVEFTRMCIQEEKCTWASLNPAVVLQLAERVQRQREEDGLDTEACLQRESEEREVAPNTQKKELIQSSAFRERRTGLIKVLRVFISPALFSRIPHRHGSGCRTQSSMQVFRSVAPWSRQREVWLSRSSSFTEELTLVSSPLTSSLTRTVTSTMTADPRYPWSR